MKKVLSIVTLMATMLFMSFTVNIASGKKKLKVRRGTHLFENCHGNAPCGPCPGMCIRLEAAETLDTVDDEYELSDEDVVNGYILMYGQIKDDGSSLELTFASSAKEFEGLWGIEKDFTLAISAAKDLTDSDRNITLVAGKYRINPELGEFGGVDMKIK
jgi:hypothetical protein